jgi:hypothetical protein
LSLWQEDKQGQMNLVPKKPVEQRIDQLFVFGRAGVGWEGEKLDGRSRSLISHQEGGASECEGNIET